ncbi:MAG: hypothetical protein ACJ735_07315 [Actinomycetes bacterium]
MFSAIARWIAPEDNPSGVVYGTVVVGTLLAAENSRLETFAKLDEAVLVALTLYWLAHAYARFLGDRFEHPGRWSMRRLASTLWHEWALIRGALSPLVVLLVGWAVGVSLASTVTWALWSCAAALVTFELVAGMRARLRLRDLVLDAALGASMGAGILLLKVILH